MRKRTLDRTRPLCVAIIGAGGFIAGAHRRALTANGAHIVAVCDIPENVDRLRKSYGTGDRTYESLDAFLTGESDQTDERPDLVVVTTPNCHHRACVMGVLTQLETNVVCEKPVGIALDEVTTMRQNAYQHCCVFGVPHPYRLRPMTILARAMVRRGLLGDLRYALFDYLQQWRLNADNWRDDVEINGPGGVVADTGIHALDLLRFVTGQELTSLSCTLRYDLQKMTDDCAMVNANTDGNMDVFLRATQTTHGQQNAQRFSITGAKGTLEFDSVVPGELVWSHGGVREVLQDDPGALGQRFPFARTLIGQTFLPAGGHFNGDFGGDGAWGLFYRLVFADVRRQLLKSFDPHREVLYANADDGWKGVQFVEACLKSSEIGGAVQVPA